MLRVSKNTTQIFTIIIVTLASLTSGILFTWPTQALQILIDTNVVTLESGSYFTVLVPAALMIFAPIFAVLVDKIGRKKTLIITTILQLLSWCFTAYGGSIWMFYIGRIFNGASDAGYYTVVPVYIAEISTPTIRGTWGNLLTFFVYLGNLTSVILVYLFEIRISALICCVLPIVLLIGMIWIPETPYYLIMGSEMDEGMKSLRWYRMREDVDVEFKQLIEDVNRQLSESGGLKDLWSIRSNRMALGVGAFLRGAQQFGGISAFSIYAQFIFTEAGGDFDAIVSTVIYASMLTVTNIFASIVLDRIGRRRSMIISCCGCGIMLTLEAVYFYLTSNGVDVGVFKPFPIIGMSLYVVFYSVGIGIMPSLMLGELFSSSVKGKCLCSMNMVYGVCLAVCTKLFQVLMTEFGYDVAFGFFAVCCFISTVVSFYLVPETKGKTLEEIQQTFKH